MHSVGPRIAAPRELYPGGVAASPLSHGMMTGFVVDLARGLQVVLSAVSRNLENVLGRMEQSIYIPSKSHHSSCFVEHGLILMMPFLEFMRRLGSGVRGAESPYLAALHQRLKVFTARSLVCMLAQAPKAPTRCGR